MELLLVLVRNLYLPPHSSVFGAIPPITVCAFMACVGHLNLYYYYYY